jgi:UDP-N-acetylglucosamine:LPS N-acetylglucosamine transferase
LYCVPNEATAEVLRQNGVPGEKVKAFGFPVNPVFAEKDQEMVQAPEADGPIKVLYIINTGKKKSGKAVERLLELPRVHLTITVGRDAELKEKLVRRTERFGDRVRVLGWTNQMPRLMLTHHLVVTKAGGATVQEAIAGRCPMILNQVIPGQEDGNAQLVKELDAGVVAEKNSEVAEWIAKAFAGDARLWKKWRENLAQVSRPDASLRIAELALHECELDGPAGKLFESNRPAITQPSRRKAANGAGEHVAVRFPHSHQLFRRQIDRARGGGFLRKAGL